jgi:hypothetical protein
MSHFKTAETKRMKAITPDFSTAKTKRMRTVTPNPSQKIHTTKIRKN